MSGADLRAALLTPRAAGGIAVVALIGRDRFTAAARLLGVGVTVDTRPRRRWLWWEGERIDQAVVVDRPERSTLELHVHGSEAELRALERGLGRLAPPPTTARAGLLARAAGAAQLDFALEQHRLLLDHGGSFARFVAAHARDATVLRSALERRRAAAALTTPCAVALCGRKNAGKSTLMNRLLFAERCLTGPTPGLTRDAVREAVMLQGYPYELIDTAGEGDPVDAIDARALLMSRAARADALVVLVVDAAAGVGATERGLLATAKPALVVRTKIDLAAVRWPDDVPPPALDLCGLAPTAGGTDDVRGRFGAALQMVRDLPPAGRLGGVAPVDDDEVELLRAELG